MVYFSIIMVVYFSIIIYTEGGILCLRLDLYYLALGIKGRLDFLTKIIVEIFAGFRKLLYLCIKDAKHG